MKTFFCEEIACGHCIGRIQNGLTEAGIGHSTDLEKKTVTIKEESRISEALEILDDLGFSAVEV